MAYKPEEKLVAEEIKKLIPVLGKKTAERLEKAYLLGDETTRKRIIENTREIVLMRAELRQKAREISVQVQGRDTVSPEDRILAEVI